jgi:hypothetical protein
MLLGKVVICLQKTETRSMLSPCTSINSKWIKDLNIRPQTLKLVYERAGNTLEVIGIGKDILNRTPAAQQLRDRMDKWDYMKLKSFCTTKEMVTKMKRPPTENEGNSNGQKTHEKILTISGHKRNANQNYTKIPPHPC